MDDEKYYQNMFKPPPHVKKPEVIKLKRYFNQDEVPDWKNTQSVQIYQVNDQMTVKQLRERWFKNNMKDNVQKFQKDEKSIKPNQYVFIWQPKFLLNQKFTMTDIKKKFMIDRLDKTFMVRVYWQWDCPYCQDDPKFIFNDQKLSDYQSQTLSIHGFLPKPKDIPQNIVVWIDPNTAQNYSDFNKIVQINKFEDFDLIQIVSNEQFKDWIDTNQNILSLPQIRLHFISNLNRPPNFSKQGIQTLRIIRSLRSESLVVFYVGSIQNTKNAIEQSQYTEDKYIQVVTSLNQLNQIFKTKFAKNQ